MAVSSTSAGDEVAALQQAVNEKLAAGELMEAMVSAQEAVASAQKAKDKVNHATGLLLVAQVQAAMGDSEEAMATAKRAKIIFMTKGVASGEGIALALQAELNFKALQSTYDAGAHRALMRTTTGMFKEAVALMHEGGVTTNVLAHSLTTLAACAYAQNDAKTAVNSAKEALDVYTELGDELGIAEAALVLAESHVIAGEGEDIVRSQMFLPMAKGHAAAAGKCAEMAERIFQKREMWDKLEKAQVVLRLERVQINAALRNVPFAYETWAEGPTAK